MVFTSNSDLKKFDDLEKILVKHKVDYIILAGFLLKIPSKMINQYPNKIINIHPSLLPKYGGKGMYGKNVETVNQTLSNPIIIKNDGDLIKFFETTGKKYSNYD